MPQPQTPEHRGGSKQTAVRTRAQTSLPYTRANIHKIHGINTTEHRTISCNRHGKTKSNRQLPRMAGPRPPPLLQLMVVQPTSQKIRVQTHPRHDTTPKNKLEHNR